MPTSSPFRPRPGLLLALLLLVAATGLTGCSTYVYDTVDYWSIAVDNRTGITLDVYVDGTFRLTVTSGTIGTLRDVHEGFHTLEAVDVDGQVRASRQVDLDRDFVWILE